jgi:hypothetical protein
MFSTLAFQMGLQKEEKQESVIENPFKLPIQYLDPSEVYVLNDIVASDLELSVVSSDKDVKPITMYHYLLNPQTPFEENMIPLWKSNYTTNTHFLEETQQVIRTMDLYKRQQQSFYKPEYETIMQIWSDTKEDPGFLERYSYMEIEMLKWVNKTPSFLQAISVVNMGSPILSFLIPFVLFLLPFFIVKIQGHPITFSIYMKVLKEISKNHFIGKMISNAENMSLQNLLYLIILVGLYGYQIYQNYMACKRFYANISRVNEQICELQRYLDYSIHNMNSFSSIIDKKPTYAAFHQTMNEYKGWLNELKTHIQHVRPFQPSFSKIGEIGTLLGCYYEIYSNKEYEAALLYSFSLNGYIHNLLGLFENIDSKKCGLASFDVSGNELEIKDEYYPSLMNESYVTNHATLEKNMVITGPNAAGKTTYLKTTTLNVIFTQQFGCGFYSSCAMKPYTHIHSYLNIPDTSGRDSLFQAESRRCKQIITEVLATNVENSRHFCIFDELYSGTNPAEATKSAYSFLLYLSKRENVDFILTTHYVDICARLKKSSIRITNWKMDAEETEEGDIKYSYKIVKGISKIQGAVKVLKDMEYPEEIIQSIMEYDKKDKK